MSNDSETFGTIITISKKHVNTIPEDREQIKEQKKYVNKEQNYIKLDKKH